MENDFIPIPATFYPVRGGASFVVRYGRRPNGNFVTKSYRKAKVKERDQFIEEWNKNLKDKNPLSFANLTPKQISEIYYCYTRLDEIGVSLKHAVDEYIRKTNPISLKLKLSEAVEKFEEIQRFEKIKESTIKNARYSVYNRLIKELKDIPIGYITSEDIKRFLGNGNDNTRANYLRNISNLFSKLKKNNYVGENPCENIKIKPVVEISKGYEPWEVYLFLLTAYKEKKWKTLAANVFTAFMGPRLEETHEINWEEIDLGKDGYVNIRSKESKTKKRRTIYLDGVSKSWLNLIPLEKRKGKISTEYATEDIGSKIRKLCKEQNDNFQLGQNMMRQSMAAHHFGFFKNIFDLRKLMGNSPNVIETNYNKLVDDEEAEIYWNLYSPVSLGEGFEKAVKEKYYKKKKIKNVNLGDYEFFGIEKEDGTYNATDAVEKKKLSKLKLSLANGSRDDKQVQRLLSAGLKVGENRTKEQQEIVALFNFKRSYHFDCQDEKKLSDINDVRGYLADYIEDWNKK